MSKPSRSFLSVAALVTLASSLLTAPAAAQSTARLRGTITDEQGAVVPGAGILLRNQATGEERSVTSDRVGEFQIPSILPGIYQLDVKASGFQTRVGRSTLEFRAEAFNLFNHPNFAKPGRIATVGSTSFGVITATRFPTGDSGAARQIQFALKLYF